MSDNRAFGKHAAAQAGGSDLLIANCAILSPDSMSGFVDGQYISIKGNKIEEISPSASTARRLHYRWSRQVGHTWVDQRSLALS